MQDYGFYLGMLFVVLGGIMEGSFSLPLKHTPKWDWENIWGAGSLMALLFVPWPLAILTVSHLGEVYTLASWKAEVAAVLFGAGWGAGGIFFGLGLAAIGMSMGLSLIMGLVAIGGSLIPLLMQHPEQLARPGGLVLVGGIFIMIIGLLICARAGHLKTRDLLETRPYEQCERHPQTSYALGLFYCVAAGLLSGLVNFALIFGDNISAAAVRQGTSLATANNAVWALVFTSNYVVNVAYCVYLCKRRRSFKKFLIPKTGKYWLAAVCMGLLWAGGIVIYGIGATSLGRFGAMVGFPVMLISSILTGNAIGAASGEWKGISSRPKYVMVLGVCLLLVATGVIAYSNRLIL